MTRKLRWSDLLLEEHDRVLDKNGVLRSDPWFQLGMHYGAAVLRELAEYIRGKAYKALESSLHFQILCDKNGIDPKKISVALAQNAIAEFDREMRELPMVLRREIPIRDSDPRSSVNLFLEMFETEGDTLGACDTLAIYMLQQTPDARNVFNLGLKLLTEWFVRGMNHYALYAEAQEKTFALKRQHDSETDISAERVLDATAQRVAGNWILDRLSEIAALNPPSLVMSPEDEKLGKDPDIEIFRAETKNGFIRQLGLGPTPVQKPRKHGPAV